jgi:hypothetical protein
MVNNYYCIGDKFNKNTNKTKKITTNKYVLKEKQAWECLFKIFKLWA